MSLINRIITKSGHDLRSPGLWRACVAECIGTLLLVFFCAAPGVEFAEDASPDAQMLRGGLASGFIVASLIWSLGHVSGAHVNPAVSLGFALTGKVSAVRALLYLPMQCGGSVAGGMILKLLSPYSLQNTTSFGVNSFDESVLHPGQALGTEMILTFALMLTVMASTDTLRFDTDGSVPLIIGLQVACGIIAGAPHSGASMNPVRTLGPAVASGRYTQLWVYIVGPLVGAALAAVSYELLFRGKFVQPRAPVVDETEEEERKDGHQAETIYSTSF